jgi:hypothetical protein
MSRQKSLTSERKIPESPMIADLCGLGDTMIEYQRFSAPIRGKQLVLKLLAH